MLHASGATWAALRAPLATTAILIVVAGGSGDAGSIHVSAGGRLQGAPSAMQRGQGLRVLDKRAASGSDLGAETDRLREVQAAILSSGAVGAAQSGPSAPSNVRISSTVVEDPASPVYDVYSATELHAALTAATTGTATIRLQPGVTYVGSFRVRHSGPGYLTITTNGPLPPPGTRVSPANKAQLATLVSPTVEQALAIEPGSSYVRLVGLAFNGATSYDVVAFGRSNSSQTDRSQVPHHLVMDRVLIDGGNAGLNKRGLGLHAADVIIENSYIYGIWRNGQDSQAIGGWNGIGRYVIRNNFLEAASENIMFGGADPAIPNIVAEDILVVGNYLYKRREWLAARNTGINVKNLFELKAARRVTVRGNVMDGSWTDGQSGIGVNIKSQNQDGACTACVTEDVLFEDNIVRNVGSGISILGTDYFFPLGKTTARVTVRNNLWLIDGAAFVGDGRFLKVGGGPIDTVIQNNTVVTTGDAYVTSYRGTQKLADGTVVPANLIASFVFTHNLSRAGNYGFYVENFGAYGWQAVFETAPQVRDNVLAGMPSAHLARYALPNLFPSLTEFWASFVDSAAGDYRLVGGAYGGAVVGADFSRLPQF